MIQKKYLSDIIARTKTLEARINNGLFGELTVGQYIRFWHGRERVVCRILKVDRYSSFDAMLRVEGFQSCLPGETSVKSALDVYDRIAGNTDRAAQFGVVAIHFEKV